MMKNKTPISFNDENIDQVALRKWIEVGLSIPEVRELNGDAGYILNNMIAKYTLASSSYAISEKALSEFKKRRIDLSATYPRRAFYGKKNGGNPFIYEHTIPVVIIRNQLLRHARGAQEIREILACVGKVAVLLRVEDQAIRRAGLVSKMPAGWQFGQNPQARYEAVGIRLSEEFLHVKGAIYR